MFEFIDERTNLYHFSWIWCQISSAADCYHLQLRYISTILEHQFNILALYLNSQVGMEGLQILKPMGQQEILANGVSGKGILENGLPERQKQAEYTHGGINVEVDLVTSEDNVEDVMVKWIVENLKFSVKEPVNAQL